MPASTRLTALPAVILLALLLPLAAGAQAGWTEADTRRVADNVSVLRLAPDLSHLSAGERAVVANLLEAGQIFQELYEDQNHPDAIWARARLTTRG